MLDADALDTVVHDQVASAWRAYRARADRACDRSFLHAAIRCAGLRLAETALAPSATVLSQFETAALVCAAEEMIDAPGDVVARWDGMHDPVA